MENTLLIKIIFCGVVASGTVGGGIYAHSTGAFNYEYSSDEKADEKNYLIVKSVAYTENVLKENLYDSNLFGQITKNFKCKFNTGENEDKDCEIYKLTDEEKQLSKMTIKNNNIVTLTKIKEEGNFFKLVVKNDAIFEAITAWEDTTKPINLLQKNVETNEKALAKLIPIFVVKEGKIVDGKKHSLIAKVLETDVSGITQPSTEISINSWNYQCLNGTTRFDCEISEVIVEKAKKTVVLKNTKTLKTLNNQEIKNHEKQFKVVAVKSYFENIDYTNQKFDVVEKIPTKDSENKKYSVLTPQFLSSEQEILSGKNNFVFAVSTAAISDNTVAADSTWTNYSKCLIGDDKEKKDCVVYRFSTAQTTTTNTEDLDFSSNLTVLTKDDDVKANNYYVIKFNPEIKKFLKSEQTIKLVSSSTEGNKKEYSFNVKENMYLDATLSSDTYTVNSVYIFEQAE